MFKFFFVGIQIKLTKSLFLIGQIVAKATILVKQGINNIYASECK